jgi:NTE family protein
MTKDRLPRIGVACQGGGSQTAFAAGVLSAVLTDPGFDRDYEVVALSGTSGGAICSLLAWYGLLLHREAPGGRGAPAAEVVHGFWEQNAASEWWDWLGNQYLVAFQRMQAAGLLGQLAPPAPVRQFAQERLRRIIEAHVRFEDLPGLLARDPRHPTLYCGAVEALDGSFAVFEDCCPDPHWHRTEDGEVPAETSVLPVLASAAVPPLFPGVRIGRARYWDGLFAYNPPIRAMLDRSLEDRPDEIWLVQIDPLATAAEPQLAAEIVDRKFELGSNLSLGGELHWVKQVNQWIDDGTLPAERFKPVRVARIEMSPPVKAGLDLASKVDRSPRHLEELITDGRERASAFLERRAGGDDACFEPRFPHRYRGRGGSPRTASRTPSRTGWPG